MQPKNVPEPSETALFFYALISKGRKRTAKKFIPCQMNPTHLNSIIEKRLNRSKNESEDTYYDESV